MTVASEEEHCFQVPQELAFFMFRENSWWPFSQVSFSPLSLAEGLKERILTKTIEFVEYVCLIQLQQCGICPWAVQFGFQKDGKDIRGETKG